MKRIVFERSAFDQDSVTIIACKYHYL